MTEEKHGAAEWLRGILKEYEASGARSCSAMAKMFGIDCEYETCRWCMTMMLTAIADRIDAERALPEGIEWPRFEDGELVKIGDEVEWDGDVMRVGAFWFRREGWSLNVFCPGLDGTFHGEYGERVKRPTPKVLDADGVPIEVGDTVYFADGNGSALIVERIDANGGEPAVDLVYAGERTHWHSANPENLTHERPDSWERLEEDAYHLVMSEYLETPEKDVSDIVRRAKALAKAGEEA